MIRKILGYALLATPFFTAVAVGVVRFGWATALTQAALSVALVVLLLLVILAAFWLIDGGRR